MINTNTNNDIEKSSSEEVINKPNLEDVKLDNSASGEGESQEVNIPETSNFSNWYTLRVVSGKEKFVKEIKMQFFYIQLLILSYLNF